MPPESFPRPESSPHPESSRQKPTDFDPKQGLPPTERPTTCPTCRRSDCTDPSHRIEYQENRGGETYPRPYEALLEEELFVSEQGPVEWQPVSERVPETERDELFESAGPIISSKEEIINEHWTPISEGVERLEGNPYRITQHTEITVGPSGELFFTDMERVLCVSADRLKSTEIRGWKTNISKFLTTPAPNQEILIDTQNGTMWLKKDGSFTFLHEEFGGPWKGRGDGKTILFTKNKIDTGEKPKRSSENLIMRQTTNSRLELLRGCTVSGGYRAMPLGKDGLVIDQGGPLLLIRPGEKEFRVIAVPEAQTTMSAPRPMLDGSILIQNSPTGGLYRLAPDEKIFRIDPPAGIKRIEAATGAPDGSIYATATSQDAKGEEVVLLRFAAPRPKESNQKELPPPTRQF